MADQHPTTLALPAGLSPDQLDIMTEMSSLLSRLRAPVTLPGTSTTGQTPAAPTPSQQQQQSSSSQPGQPSQSSSAAAAAQSQGDISLRDFPASTDHLRLKLQEAKGVVLALPDMDKSVGQQEAEIRRLEDRIRRQREQLAALREKGNRFASTDRMEE
ncbi:RNA polymerase II transcription mediator complex subunit 9-domain-containing protein [Pestalotiopsis sp. NC0098]|nr:RNA polymerase II transcription mediator complex subunit 9-domain-containing protein [Pestalotiopsis sp. NC0098]